MYEALTLGHYGTSKTSSQSKSMGQSETYILLIFKLNFDEMA